MVPEAFRNDSAHLGRGFKPPEARLAAIRVIVCGGRDYADRVRVFQALDAAHAKRPIKTLVHGGAPGADSLAQDLGRERGYRSSDETRIGSALAPKAGPVRNQQMADAGAGGCIAFPGGIGTTDVVRRATAVGIPRLAALWLKVASPAAR